MRASRQARILHAVATACLVAGAILLAWPGVLIFMTGRTAAGAQAEALAAWDQAAQQPRSAGRSVTAAGMVLVIPKLNVRRFVPDGATVDHLQRYGVGRISWTALPDEDGIVAIAGHRTTYGAPFFRLDRLRRGDLVRVEYAGRQYTYVIERQETVRPDRADVLQQDAGGRSLALVSCSPAYSAAFRLIIFAPLQRVASVVPQAGAPHVGLLTPDGH